MNPLARLLALALIHIERCEGNDPDSDVKLLESLSADLASAPEADRMAVARALQELGEEEMIEGLGVE